MKKKQKKKKIRINEKTNGYIKEVAWKRSKFGSDKPKYSSLPEPSVDRTFHFIVVKAERKKERASEWVKERKGEYVLYILKKLAYKRNYIAMNKLEW